MCYCLVGTVPTGRMRSPSDCVFSSVRTLYSSSRSLSTVASAGDRQQQQQQQAFVQLPLMSPELSAQSSAKCATVAALPIAVIRLTVNPTACLPLSFFSIFAYLSFSLFSHRIPLFSFSPHLSLALWQLFPSGAGNQAQHTHTHSQAGRQSVSFAIEGVRCNCQLLKVVV